MSKKGMSARTIIISLASVFAVAAAVLIIIFRTADMRTYGRAQKMEESGDYYGALDTYQLIPDYKDCRTRIKECKYQIALLLEEAGEYSQAQMSFEYLGKYLDAPDHAIQCKYQGALLTEEAGEYEKARSIFEELGDYEDAPEHLKECDYQVALGLMTEERYEEAIDAFTELGGFKDAREQVLECQYQIASLYAYYKRYDEALEMFQALGDYSDAADQVKECQYQTALGLEESGSVDAAMAIFESLGDYKDAPEHLKGRQYQEAVALFEQGSTDSAMRMFTELGDYMDSAEYLQKCRYAKAVVLEATGSAREALNMYQSVGDYEDAWERVKEISRVIDEYEKAKKSHDELEVRLDEALQEALTLLGEENAFWDASLRDELGAAYERTVAERHGYFQGEEPLTRPQYEQATEIIAGLDDTPYLEGLQEIMKLVREGEERLALLAEADLELVEDRLPLSREVAVLLRVADDEDPEGLLTRRCLGAFYFSSASVQERYAYEPYLDVLSLRTDAGGAVEVFQTPRDAARRAEALADNGEGVRCMGTVVIRTSRLLSPEEQSRICTSLFETISDPEPAEPFVRTWQWSEEAEVVDIDGEEEDYDDYDDYEDEEEDGLPVSLFDGELSYEEIVTGHFRMMAPKDWVNVSTNSWEYYYPRSQEGKGGGYMAVKEEFLPAGEEDEEPDPWEILSLAALDIAQGKEYFTDRWLMHDMPALWVRAGSTGSINRGLVLYDQGFVLYVKTLDEGDFAGADAGSMNLFGFSTVTTGEDFVKTLEVACLQKGDYLRYTVLVQNVMEQKAIRQPEFLVTALDENGETMAEGSFSMPLLYPGQTAAWASLLPLSEEPARVEVVLKAPGKQKLVSPSELSHPDYRDLQVVEDAITARDAQQTLSGVVVNDNGYDISLALLTVIFRDGEGKLLVGEHAFVNDVLKNSRTSFSFDLSPSLVNENFEVYAMPWYFRSRTQEETTEVTEPVSEAATEATTESETRSEAGSESQTMEEETTYREEASSETTWAPKESGEESTEAPAGQEDVGEAATAEEGGMAETAVREEVTTEVTTAAEISTETTTEAAAEKKAKKKK